MRLNCFVPAAAAALLLPALPARAADVTVGADFNSAYVWRGLTFSGDPVVQPSIDVGGLKLGKVPLNINVWGNFNLGDWDGTVEKNQYSEIDFTVTAELPKGFSVGFIEYVFTVGEPSTRELTAAWGHDFSFATPTVSFFYDVEQIDSGFLMLGLSRELALGQQAALELKAEAGYAGEGFAQYYGGEKAGFYQYNLVGKLSYKLGENGSLSGTVGYTDGFDRAILPKQDARFYGGINASYSF
jgi:hypothetical protein